MKSLRIKASEMEVECNFCGKCGASVGAQETIANLQDHIKVLQLLDKYEHLLDKYEHLLDKYDAQLARGR